MIVNNFFTLWFKQAAISACLILLLCCHQIRADDGKLEERRVTVAAVQDLKFHMSSGKISFTEKGETYELDPPAGTRESRIDIGIKLLAELRRASHLSLQVYINDEGESIVQPHSWVFHYKAGN